MQKFIDQLNGRSERRAFIKAAAAGGAVAGAALIAGTARSLAQQATAGASYGPAVTKGDIAILQFLAVAETIEADLWLQYAELGGTQDSELPGLPTGGSAAYTAKLQNLDGDMPQYFHDNTEDEFSHWFFLDAFLQSLGATPVSLDSFRTLPSSKATGANQIGRLTNLMQLTVDTSWYTRYRSRTHNPDLNPGFT